MTVTIDLINSGALKLLQDMECLNLIRVHSGEYASSVHDPSASYLAEPFPTIEELKAEAGRKAAERFAEMERTGVDPLARFAGSLKDVFPEDGLVYQRMLRDEWPD
jgi:hypothetical protein